MKIGQRRTDPVTKAKGHVVNIIGKQAVCLTDDGQRFFRLPLEKKQCEKVVRRNRPRRPCTIKIRGIEGVMIGVTVTTAGGRKGAMITDGNLIWHGCVVGKGEAKIVLLGRGRPKKGQREEVLAVGARR